jgi:hypothetical protein
MANYEWYKAGSVTVRHGDTEIIGTNTDWLKAGIKTGDIFIIDNLPYEIADVTGSTSLVLAKAYAGESAGDKEYSIITRAGEVLQAEIALKLQQAITNWNEREKSYDAQLKELTERTEPLKGLGLYRDEDGDLAQDESVNMALMTAGNIPVTQPGDTQEMLNDVFSGN